VARIPKAEGDAGAVDRRRIWPGRDCLVNAAAGGRGKRIIEPGQILPGNGDRGRSGQSIQNRESCVVTGSTVRAFAPSLLLMIRRKARDCGWMAMLSDPERPCGWGAKTGFDRLAPLAQSTRPDPGHSGERPSPVLL
jgi:hypothetical protein